MKVLKSDNIKNELITNITNNKRKKNLLIISQSPDESVKQYKKSIIKRCKEFNIDFFDCEFDLKCNHCDIVKKVNSLENVSGFIVLQPLNPNTDLDYLRANIKHFDLDGFTYNSLGKIMTNKFENLPQTAKSVIRFIDEFDIEISGKNVVIANSNNVIGRPLAMYLNSKKATVTLFNSKTRNQKEKIKASDIFISAIGKPCFYDKSNFRDGQILIDVGISFKSGKIYGDIDLESIKDLDVKIVTSKAGVGSITTLSLLDSLISN